MKNILSAFVVALTLTGATAFVNGPAAAKNDLIVFTSTKVSAFPVPTCPPDDPNGCGIAGN